VSFVVVRRHRDKAPRCGALPAISTMKSWIAMHRKRHNFPARPTPILFLIFAALPMYHEQHGHDQARDHAGG